MAVGQGCGTDLFKYKYMFTRSGEYGNGNLDLEYDVGRVLFSKQF